MLAVGVALGVCDPGMEYFRANTDGEGEAMLMRAMLGVGRKGID